MKIEFIPASEDVEKFVSPPELMKKNIPSWYKKIENFSEKDMEISFDQGNKPYIKNSSLKMCMPFLDSIVSGYVQKTWCDIYIEKKDSEIFFSYSHGPEIIKIRDKVSLPLPNDFYQLEFLWMVPWIPKLPKGYSCLFTNPSNIFDIPFTNTNGIIDSDNFYHMGGQYPFYIKNNFHGVIPEGTMMYQMFPIKRETWESQILQFNNDRAEKNRYFIQKKFWGQYKNFLWNKKTFY